MSTEQRKFHRIAGSGEPCALELDTTQIHGRLSDESISGAKISELDLLMLPYNKQMNLSFREGEVDVRARNISRDENGKFRLGVVRSEMLSREQLLPSTAMLLNCYVIHGGACVICMPVRVESETQALIQLWDGVQFRVPRDHLRPLTRTERYEMLADEKCQQYTAAMYGISPTQDDLQKMLFEHEFGEYESCPVSSSLAATS